MDVQTVRYSNMFTAVIVALAAAALLTYVGYIWFGSCRGLPRYEGFQVKGGPAAPGPNAEAAMLSNPAGTMAEGFWAGPARGAGVPDCLRSNSSAAAVYDLFAAKMQTTEEGPDDLRELALILGKISCFKRDLLGAASVVEATRYQPFSTAHDMEPVAETTARCFSGTLPRRDLELSLEKWGTRGTFLIKRLCTSVNLREAEEEEALGLFGAAMGDITEIAIGRCCAQAAEVNGGKSVRMVGGYEPPGLNELRQYTGLY
jgi:hypothetical protein